MAVYTYCRDLSTTKPKKIFVAVLIASAFEPNSETHDRSGIPMIVQYKFIVYYCVLFAVTLHDTGISYTS